MSAWHALPILSRTPQSQLFRSAFTIHVYFGFGQPARAGRTPLMASAARAHEQAIQNRNHLLDAFIAVTRA